MTGFVASTSSTFTSRFVYGDKVTIDDDKSIVGTITAFSFRNQGYEIIEVCWMANGDVKVAWFEHWRLKHWDIK